MKTLIHAPVFKLVIGLICGIILGQFLGYWMVTLFFPAFLLMLFLRLREKQRNSFVFEYLKTLSISLLIIMIGGLWWLVNQNEKKDSALEEINCREVVLGGKIISEVRSNQYGRNASFQVFGYWENCEWKGMEGKAKIYLDTTVHTHIEKYDSLTVKAWITTAYSKSAGYLSYLNDQGIFHSLYAKEVNFIGREESINHYPEIWQKLLSKQIETLISDTLSLSIAQAMFLGDKRSMDRETRDQFSVAGLSHILAISGLHVGIVFGVLSVLFLPLHMIRIGFRLKSILILLVLIGYMLVTGASPAVVRAVIMLGTILLFKLTYQRFHILNVLGISAFIQLMYDPDIVFNIGFQLSYSAVLGIVLILPLFEKLMNSDNLFLKYFFGWIGVTIAASIATFPFVWIYFGQFPTYFLLSNILTSLLVSVIVFVGFLMVMFAFVPGLNIILGKITESLLEGLVFIVKGINELPNAVILSDDISAEAIRVVCLQLFLAFLFFLIPRILKIRFRPKEKAYSLPALEE